MAASSSTPPNNSSHSSAVPPSAMPFISPSALLHAHLSHEPSIRPSNRTSTQFRPISLNISSLTHSNGSSLIRIGDTAVVCGVRAEILPVSEIANFRVDRIAQQAPTPGSSTSSLRDVQDGEEEDLQDYNSTEIPTHSLVVPNLELSTGCSPAHLPGSPPSTEAQSVSQRLLSLLHTSRLVRPSDLRIYYTPPLSEAVPRNEGATISTSERSSSRELKAYWTLYIDILVISYGGSIFDAAWLALLAALHDTLLPRAWWDIDISSVLCSPETAEAKELRLSGSPVPLSFGVFVPDKRTSNVGNAKEQKQQQFWVLCDMDAFEEGCCRETGTVVVDKGNMIGEGNEEWLVVKLEKNGGDKVGRDDIKALIHRAAERWAEWNTVLSSAAPATAK